MAGHAATAQAASAQAVDFLAALVGSLRW